ncbi:hypothetical protein [Actinoplanes subtropicus]|uniref:hypothetical protein n=1 Tax=Actinoplanes subtropicus TaxID=543632 RepID=UPI0004C3ADB4|nr:hypothetical protein [Actinoplanes subtropicus]
MVTAVGSVSGAPGASCAALGMAALWSPRPALAVEADPGGGVLAARFGLPQGPGLARLAAAARHGAPVVGAARFVQQVPLGLNVIAGPGDAREAASAVTILAARPQAAVRHLAPVVVLDLGRLYVDSPALRLLSAADAVVLVTHPTDEHLHHLYTRLPDLHDRARPGALGLAVTGKTHYTAQEIAGQLGAPVWAYLPRDRWGAGVLTGRMTGRVWFRTRLAHTLKALAAQLSATPRPAGLRTVS